MKKSHEKRILVVDDEENIRLLLDKFFSKLGYQVSTAMDLTESIYSINKKVPEIVFLDIVLPGCNGVEILKLIRLFEKDVIVIMMSGYDDENIAKESLKLGAFDYVKKPLELDRVENMLKLIDAKFS